MNWLGVDGGGTTTGFAVYDENLNEKGSFSLGTCHFGQVGFDGMRAVIATGIGRAMADYGLGDEFGIGVGMCGFGEGAETSTKAQRVVAELAGAHPHILINDVQAACAAALDMEDGITIVAGTGSIAYGTCGDRDLRIGGWDYQIGDEGSGYWMTKQMLSAYSRQVDGRHDRGPLVDVLCDGLGLVDPYDLIGFMRYGIGDDRTKVAGLSKYVTDAAKKGDPDALAILRGAAWEDAGLINPIVQRLFGGDEGPSIPVSYIGGTFKAGDLLLGPLEKLLPTRCRLIKPKHEASIGAVLVLKKKLEGGVVAKGYGDPHFGRG